MKNRTQVKEDLVELAESTLRVSKMSLEALEVLIPDSSAKDLNTLYNNSLKNHKSLIDQILSIEKEEREERINQMSESNTDLDLSRYNLES